MVVANSAPCWGLRLLSPRPENLCEDLLYLNGAFAEYVRVPTRFVEHNTYALPTDLAFGKAALTEPLACVLHGMDACELAPLRPWQPGRGHRFRRRPHRIAVRRRINGGWPSRNPGRSQSEPTGHGHGPRRQKDGDDRTRRRSGRSGKGRHRRRPGGVDRRGCHGRTGSLGRCHSDGPPRWPHQPVRRLRTWNLNSPRYAPRALQRTHR